METKELVVHEAALRNWIESDDLPRGVSRPEAIRVLDHIESDLKEKNPRDIIKFEGSVKSKKDINDLVKQVGKGNKVRMKGVRGQHCLPELEKVFKQKGISVELDYKGMLP